MRHDAQTKICGYNLLHDAQTKVCGYRFIIDAGDLFDALSHAGLSGIDPKTSRPNALREYFHFLKIALGIMA